MCNITVCLVGYVALRKKANIYLKKYILNLNSNQFINQKLKLNNNDFNNIIFYLIL